MEPKTAWRNLDNSLLIDIPEEPGKAKIEPGSNSLEKIKQTVREKSVLEAIYLTKNMYVYTYIISYYIYCTHESSFFIIFILQDTRFA